MKPERVITVAMVATVATAFLLVSCGGSTPVGVASGSDPETTAASSTTAPEQAIVTSEETAASNIDGLQAADNPFDVQLLDTSDGTVTTIREQVDPARPVLLWFWAPH